MKTFDVIVVGGGFPGIYASWALANAGATVALIDAAPKLGGVLNSRQWNGYHLDNGTHNLDARTERGHSFYADILGEDFRILSNHTWASTCEKNWTQGFEFPDISADNPELAENILAELAGLAELKDVDCSDDSNFADWLRGNYGSMLADHMLPMVRKFIGSDPSNLAPAAMDFMPNFRRPKLGSDALMVSLKRTSEFWDQRLGVTMDAKDDRFLQLNRDPKFAYPRKGGIGRFCERSEGRLTSLGVELFLSQPVLDIAASCDCVSVKLDDDTVTSKQVFWTLPNAALLKLLGSKVDLNSSFVPVGYGLFAFEVMEKDVRGPDYLHDYSDRRAAFRYNRLGVYGRQTKKDGKTVVMAEVPCHPEQVGQVLENENKAWSSLIESGYLAQNTEAYSSAKWAQPVAFALPKRDADVLEQVARKEIQAFSEKVVLIGTGKRGRAAFVDHYHDHLEHLFHGAL